MKKLFFLIFIIPVFAEANQDSVRIKTDTLKTFNDKVFVETVTYSNNEMVESYKAYLFPTTIQRQRYKWTSMFNSTFLADSVVYQGEKLTFSKNGFSIVEKYDNGKQTSVKYYNADNQEISIEEFNSGRIKFGPCGIKQGTYIIKGKIKTSPNKK